MSSDLYKALASDVRRTLVELLRTGTLSTSELAASFDMSRIGVSKHLALLEEAGVVRSEKHGRQRLWHLVIRDLPDPGAAPRRWIGAFQVPPSRLWAALTGELRMWWPAADLDPDTVDLRLEAVPGGRLVEVFGGGGGVLRATVLELRPVRALVLGVPEGALFVPVRLTVGEEVVVECGSEAQLSQWTQRLDGPFRAWTERGVAGGFGA